MSWHGHRPRDAFETNQKIGIRGRHIVRFHQIRTGDASFQIRHTRAQHIADFAFAEERRRGGIFAVFQVVRVVSKLLNCSLKFAFVFGNHCNGGSGSLVEPFDRLQRFLNFWKIL